MKTLNVLVRPFVLLVERYYPNPFVFAIVLTFLTVLLALGLTESSIMQTVVAWGEGLSTLFAFTTQVCLTLIGAHVLSHTSAVRKLLVRFSDLPRTQFQAYALVALITSVCSLMAWSLGLVAGAILAKEVAIQSQQKKLKLHYPLLVASAYSGFVVWHMGYSGSATLSVATPGHPLEAEMQGTLPITETMLATENIVLALVCSLAVALVCPLLRPPSNAAIEVDVRKLKEEGATKAETLDCSEEGRSLGDRLDNMRALNISIGALFAVYLFHWFYTQGLALNLDIVIWSFICLGLFLADSPAHYLKLLVKSGSSVGLILLQFPFYAGILGIMKGTGLVSVLSNFFANIATSQTLPFFAFLSGGLINIFVPSGGGQWVLQGPIFLEAAKDLNVDPALIVLGVAYGDQWTNMIQPFWTIPLLAIAGLPLRQVMGYTFIIFVLTFFLFGGSLLFLF